MAVVFSITILFILYLRRFKQDFEEDQRIVFLTACLVIAIITLILIAITQ